LSALDLMSTPHKNTGNDRQEILSLLKEHAPDDMTVAEIAEAMPELNIDSLRHILKRMYDKGDIEKSGRGSYHAK
jgi:predicted transcriptional regulator of viral defense system